MKPILLIFLVFIITACNEDWSTNYNSRHNKMNIYIAKQGEGLVHSDTPVEKLDLESIPWIKSSDIEFYDWSAHAFYLNKEVEKAKYSGRSFVVCYDQERLFIGVFWPPYMSSFPSVPSIIPSDEWFSPKDVILLNTFGWLPDNDLNYNEEFKAALIKADLLKEGIEVELTKLEKVNASTLNYTFSIKNMESENIYVLDPSKMGAGCFHYYTNGVSLRQGNNYLFASGFETEAFDEIKDEWYYKLKPGETISRTVQISGYSDIPTGEVEAYFQFPGANMREKGEWVKSDGRVWIGEYRTKASEIYINN